MPKSKFLIADDNLTNVELLEAYLDGIDGETAVAVDGLDTLAKVAEFQPDLILLDIMMPKLSGFEVCKTLKRDANTRQIMILMVTALNEQGDIERAVAAGCDDFLSKPVNKLELVKRVEIMLKLRHVTDELERLRRYIDGMEEPPTPTLASASVDRHPDDDEVNDQENGHDVHQPLYVAALAGQQLDGRIGDETQRQPVGDRKASSGMPAMISNAGRLSA